MLEIQKDRHLSEFSTFGIGGPIRYFVEIYTVEQLKEAFQLNLPTMVIGKGSNCLFDDQGFNGLVILNKIDFCHWEKESVKVGAGYSFSLLGVQTARKGFAGLEFASGIPASVGGALFMNAGANGNETCNSLKSVEYFDGNAICIYLKEELEFGYRTSPFQKMKGAIVSATFALNRNPEARKNQLKIVEYRMATQPLKEKSIGCIFRNPPDVFAGNLIERSGLKGAQIGGAKISEVHANFMINVNGASAKDVKDLIRLVQERVFEQTGIFLEPEVRMINAK